jgi:hypothetical protein
LSHEKRLSMALSAPREDAIMLAMDMNEWRAPAVLETARRFVETGRLVYVIGATAFLKDDDPLAIVVKHGGSAGVERAIRLHLVEDAFGLDRKYKQLFEEIGAKYIENKNFFVRGGVYRIYTADDEDLLMYDKYHLTLPGAKEYGKYLAENYPDIASSKGQPF